MRRLTLSAVAVLGVLSLALPAYANKQPSAQAEATKLVQLVTPKPRYDAMMSQMVDQMVPAMTAQTGKAMTPEMKTKLLAAVNEAVPYEELVQWSADIYAELFTAAELKQLIQFYETPVGKKSAKLLPELMGRVGQKIGSTLPARLPDALKKHGLAP